MKFFIINLPCDSERRERMVRRCGELGLDYEIVEAIDGRRLSADELAAAQGLATGQSGAQDLSAQPAAAQPTAQPAQPVTSAISTATAQNIQQSTQNATAQTTQNAVPTAASNSATQNAATPHAATTTSKRYKKPLTPGEIGCALSHRKALARLLELGLPHAVILEDDAVFGGALAAFLRLVPRFPPELELLLLGHYRQVYLDDGFRVESPFSLRYDLDLGEGHRLKRLVGGGLGAHGYFVTARGAARLLAASEPVRRPYDHYTSDDAAVNVFALHPVVVEFEFGGESSVQGARREKKRPLIAKLFKRLRKWAMFFPRSLMPLRKYEVNGSGGGGENNKDENGKGAGGGANSNLSAGTGTGENGGT